MRTWARHALELQNQRLEHHARRAANPEQYDVLHSSKYHIDRRDLSDHIRRYIHELEPDERVKQFVKNCYDDFDSITWRNIRSCVVRPALSLFGWSNTDIHGYLQTGGMHLLSTKQIRTLLKLGEAESLGVVLDIGAGDGGVTSYIEPLFREVVATDVSDVMVERLRSRGYESFCTDDITTIPSLSMLDVSVVCLLNVLDRCDKPLMLLKQIHSVLANNRHGDGRLLLAVVLPFCPFYESGSTQVAPEERLHADREWVSFEDSVSYFVDEVFSPCAYTLDSVSRVPYLSQGDMYNPIYTLDCAIFVLSVQRPKRHDSWRKFIDNAAESS